MLHCIVISFSEAPRKWIWCHAWAATDDSRINTHKYTHTEKVRKGTERERDTNSGENLKRSSWVTRWRNMNHRSNLGVLVSALLSFYPIFPHFFLSACVASVSKVVLFEIWIIMITIQCIQGDICFTIFDFASDLCSSGKRRVWGIKD